MKVYVVTKGKRSDYHICGVTLDYEKAEQMAERVKGGWGYPQIEEYDTKDTDEALRWSGVYHCMKQSNVISVGKEHLDYVDFNNINKIHNYSDFLLTEVYANSKEEATKKAIDLFAKYEAEKLGL